MKRALLIASACTALLTGCTSQGIDKHWETESTLPRMGRFFLGYNGEKDGTYRDFARRRGIANRKTLMRHFLNINEDNPNHAVSANKGVSILSVPDYAVGVFYEGGLDGVGDALHAVGEPVRIITSTFAHEIVGPPLRGVVTGVASVLPKRETEGGAEEDAVEIEEVAE